MRNVCTAVVLLTACGSVGPRPETPPEAAVYAGAIVDMHTHVMFDGSTMGTSRPATAAVLLRAMDAAGVSRAGIITVAPRGDLEATRRQNDALHTLVEAHPERFFAIGSVHPADGEAALEELERIAALGFAGLKLHPNSQDLDVSSPDVYAVVERAASLGLPVLFDGYNPFDADQTGKVLMLAARLPNARIVLAHMGGPRFAEAAVFGMVQGLDWYPRNVWVDLSVTATTFVDSPFEEQLVWVARQIGVDRVLFGSDFPVSTPTDAVDAVRRLGFSLEEQRLIFEGNARQLFPPPE